METATNKKENANLENYINWFEIPVLNLSRAVEFYNQIYGIEMEVTETNGYAMAFFPAEKGISGALVMGPGCVPSHTGSLIYLNAGENLQHILEKVEINGGRVILEKTKIEDDAGHFALFIDPEGNKLALHSKKEAKPAVKSKPVTKSKPVASKSKQGQKKTGKSKNKKRSKTEL